MIRLVLDTNILISTALPGSRLHVYYGFTNYYLAMMGSNPHLRNLKPRIETLARAHGVIWHGMVGQKELA